MINLYDCIKFAPHEWNNTIISVGGHQNNRNPLLSYLGYIELLFLRENLVDITCIDLKSGLYNTPPHRFIYNVISPSVSESELYGGAAVEHNPYSVLLYNIDRLIEAEEYLSNLYKYSPCACTLLSKILESLNTFKNGVIYVDNLLYVSSEFPLASPESLLASSKLINYTHPLFLSTKFVYRYRNTARAIHPYSMSSGIINLITDKIDKDSQISPTLSNLPVMYNECLMSYRERKPLTTPVSCKFTTALGTFISRTCPYGLKLNGINKWEGKKCALPPTSIAINGENNRNFTEGYSDTLFMHELYLQNYQGDLIIPSLFNRLYH